MSHITLTDEQTRVLETAEKPVEVRAPDGRILTTLIPLTPQERSAVEVSKQRLARGAKRISSQALLAVLDQAEEMARQEEMTPEKMSVLLRRARAGEAP